MLQNHAQPHIRDLKKILSSPWQIGFVVLLLLAVDALCIGMRHDYQEYANQWAHIAAGGNPWVNSGGAWTGNAYGPVHVLFAPLYTLYPLAPKALFIAAYVAMAFYLIRRCVMATQNMWERLFVVSLVGASPFFLVFTLAAGTHDILVAASVLAAVVFLKEGREALSGIALGFGTLLKVVPIFAFAILAVKEGRTLRWRFVGSFFGTLGFGFLTAAALWGESVMAPFVFAGDRPSKMLSVFRFLRGAYSPLKNIAPSLDYLSLPCMALGLGLVISAYLRGRLRWHAAVVLSMLVPISLYKVGHHQFYAVIFVLIPYWLYDEHMHPQLRRKLWAGVAPLLFWISFNSLLYAATFGLKGRHAWYREWIGLPTFLFFGLATFSIVRYGRVGGSREGCNQASALAFDRPRNLSQMGVPSKP